MLQRVYEESSEQCASDFNISSQIIDSGDPPLKNFERPDDQKQHYEATIKSLDEKINSLEIQVYNLETKLNQTMYEKLLASDEKCSFYTNIDKVELLNVLHSKIAPLIRRRFDYVQDQETRRFKTTPKKFGPDTKLESKDEFLLTLMKLRLGLLGKYIAHRFGISNTLCPQIFHSRIRCMAEYFRSFVPDIETILVTTPKRYRHFENLIRIIDCSEMFVETPKNLELQGATWSEYKHHNTLKFLVCAAPNSAITFVSKAYTGRISDKEITLKSVFLDMLPRYSSIMTDKGFNLFDKCAPQCLHFTVPPGRRGASQMTPAEINKTSAIAKVRILVEQVIRRSKTFQIIANEMPISLLSHVNDTLIICSALCNFKELLYND